MVFLLAMVLYPDVLERAQAAVDAVVGPDRTPAFDELVNIPYIEALMKEVLRWRSVAPISNTFVSAMIDYLPLINVLL